MLVAGFFIFSKIIGIKRSLDKKVIDYCLVEATTIKSQNLLFKKIVQPSYSRVLERVKLNLLEMLSNSKEIIIHLINHLLLVNNVELLSE